jgi:hypothetical protein
LSIGFLLFADSGHSSVIADHWLITIVLALIVSGAIQNSIRAIIEAAAKSKE